MTVRKWLMAALAGGSVLFAVALATAEDKKETKKDEAKPAKVDEKKTDAAKSDAKKDEAKKDEAAGAKVGQDGPDFTLKNTAGEEVKLSAYKDKIVVLQWVNKECPWCRGSNEITKDLYKKWTAKGVVWLAIDSTNWTKADETAKYEKEKELPYKTLLDNDGKVGLAYGAKTTPHIFILNKGKLVYAGALHNDQQGSIRKKIEAGEAKPEEFRNYVDEALTALTDGKPVPVAETKSWGCSVKYKQN